MQISDLLTFLEVGHGPYYGDCRINIPDFYPVCEIFTDISQNSVSTKIQESPPKCRAFTELLRRKIGRISVKIR